MIVDDERDAYLYILCVAKTNFLKVNYTGGWAPYSLDAFTRKVRYVKEREFPINLLHLAQSGGFHQHRPEKSVWKEARGLYYDLNHFEAWNTIFRTPFHNVIQTWRGEWLSQPFFQACLSRQVPGSSASCTAIINFPFFLRFRLFQIATQISITFLPVWNLLFLTVFIPEAYFLLFMLFIFGGITFFSFQRRKTVLSRSPVCSTCLSNDKLNIFY